MKKFPVLYLRQSTGGGGGADTMIANSVPLMKQSPFSILLVYLRKPAESIDAIYKTLADRDIAYIDLPGASFFDWSQFMEIARIIRKLQIRIVHCHDPKCDVYGYFLHFLFPSVCFVSTLHGWIAKRARSHFYVALDKFAVRNFDAVIAVSDQILKTATQQGIKNIHVVKNSIDVKQWRQEGGRHSKPNSSKIGFIGRLSPEKGPMDFVRVARQVLEKYPAAEFHVAGAGTEDSAMKQLVRQLGIESRFHFSGHLDEQQLRSYYRNLDILLSTSHTEGVPLTLLEAGAMEIPVVATEVGGVGEVIRHEKNGLLACAGDIASLSNQVLRLLNDKIWARKLGVEGRNIVEKEFSIEANVSKVTTIYEKIIQVA